MTDYPEREGLSRAFLQLARSERNAGLRPCERPTTDGLTAPSSPTSQATPRCAVCGGPFAAGAGCEFCPKLFAVDPLQRRVDEIYAADRAQDFNHGRDAR